MAMLKAVARFCARGNVLYLWHGRWGRTVFQVLVCQRGGCILSTFHRVESVVRVSLSVCLPMHQKSCHSSGFSLKLAQMLPECDSFRIFMVLFCRRFNLCFVLVHFL